MTNNIAPNWSTEITLTSPNKTTKNGCSEVKASASNAGEPGSIPGLGRSPGEGNGNPLLYSCLENPMDWGAWWAAVHRVTKSRTRLSDFTYLLPIIKLLQKFKSKMNYSSYSKLNSDDHKVWLLSGLQIFSVSVRRFSLKCLGIWVPSAATAPWAFFHYMGVAPSVISKLK